MRFIAGYRWCRIKGVGPAYGGDIMVGIVGKGKGKRKENRRQMTEDGRLKTESGRTKLLGARKLIRELEN